MKNVCLLSLSPLCGRFTVSLPARLKESQNILAYHEGSAFHVQGTKCATYILRIGGLEFSRPLWQGASPL